MKPATSAIRRSLLAIPLVFVAAIVSILCSYVHPILGIGVGLLGGVAMCNLHANLCEHWDW